jgi:uracil-DNA glycosylase
MFSALKATRFEEVKVLLLGQDPYHGPGEAHGMCFSVRPGIKVPPSLVNIYKELQDDLGCTPPPHGFLLSWALQGVLLLNTVLTVRANEPASHKEQGWEQFTDAIIKALNARKKPLVYLLWGAHAQKKEELIDGKRHRVFKAAHPSPLSAKKFFGSKPFSVTNTALAELGHPPINWQLPQDPAGPVAVAARAAAPPAAVPAPVAAPKPAPKEEPTHLETLLPDDWRAALADDLKKSSFRSLDKFLAGERRDATVYPAEDRLFAALRLTPLKSVRVVLLGQEPPCQDDIADGLAFSVREGVDPSDVQQALFRELRNDLGCRIPATGSLEPWARQGVLLVNLLWTVRAGRPGSHKDKGWESFTDAVLKAVNAGQDPVVFVLLGLAARKKAALLDDERHVVITGEHPAVAPDKLLGSGVFSEINHALETRGRSGIYWQLPYV